MKGASRAFFVAVLASSASVTFPGMTEGGVELIVNGNFETGTFAGWTTLDQPGGLGSWFVDSVGTSTPFSGMLTLGNPNGGAFYAVTDQSGPGAHVLIQSFAVPVGATSLTLSFEMFVNDWDAGPIVNPAGLTFTAGPNQHARVDILTAGATPFSTAPADIVGNFYLGVDPGVDPHPFTPYSFNVTGMLAPGTSYQLRFGEVDNQFFLNHGVDNVSIDAELSVAPTGVPEVSSFAAWTLCLGAILCGRSVKRRRRIE
jgi:hypothetical protein